jgi:4-amino-4-deoxy-L-arabinose transferase-like glycosyltransferase
VLGRTSTSLRNNLLDWLREHRIDCVIVCGLVAVALALRVSNLTHIPPGFNGDEAWTGLDAKRILDTGLIGPYVPSAVGQPAGPVYFAAPFVAVFGQTVFAVRFAMATLGVATVAMTYVTFRIMFDRPTATIAAFLLSVSAWHIHFSRMGFMVISWPLIELVALALFFLALRTNRLGHYMLCGLALGAGIYTYNAYPIFLLPFGLFVLWMAWVRRRDNLRTYAIRIGLLGAFSVLAALPLILYAADSSNNYFFHPHHISITATSEWKQGSFTDRADLVLDSTRHVYADMFWRGSPDVSDAFAADGVVDRVSLVLLGIGVILSLWRWRQPPYVALLLMFGLLPFASILTIGVGELRRTFGVAPFLAALEAVPLASLWRGIQRERWLVRGAKLGAIALVGGAIMFLNLNYYFREFPGDVLNRKTFAVDVADASRYMRKQPGDPYVYFYDGRLSFYDEARRYLAPDVLGEDRSATFSTSKTVRLDADRTRNVLFVFIEPYVQLAGEVGQLYPGGVRHDEFFKDGATKFIGYYLPSLAPGATPPPGVTPVPTPTREVLPGGEDRDRARFADMERIQQALIVYQQKYQEFPTNGGAIQPLCTGPKRDAGCRLSEFLDPMPQNPTGDHAKGYFYASNGLTYRIFAYRESDVVPQCNERPEDLADLVDLMCVKGP